MTIIPAEKEGKATFRKEANLTMNGSSSSSSVSIIAGAISSSSFLFQLKRCNVVDDVDDIRLDFVRCWLLKLICLLQTMLDPVAASNDDP